MDSEKAKDFTLKVLYDSEKFYNNTKGLYEKQIYLAVAILQIIERQKALRYLCKQQKLIPIKEEYGWDFEVTEVSEDMQFEDKLSEYLNDNFSYIKKYNKLYHKVIKKNLEDNINKLNKLKDEFHKIDEFI